VAEHHREHEADAELLVAGRRVKATPAFDTALCARVGIAPLAFDGSPTCPRGNGGSTPAGLR
jgi:hypothetical protein